MSKNRFGAGPRVNLIRGVRFFGGGGAKGFNHRCPSLNYRWVSLVDETTRSSRNRNPSIFQAKPKRTPMMVMTWVNQMVAFVVDHRWFLAKPLVSNP